MKYSCVQPKAKFEGFASFIPNALYPIQIVIIAYY